PRSIAVKPNDPRTVFVTLGDSTPGRIGTVMRSRDAGATWQNLQLPPSPTRRSGRGACPRRARTWASRRAATAIPIGATTAAIRGASCGANSARCRRSSGCPVPEITGLGHVGLYCHDLAKMREFYAGVLGLTISDEDLGRGICFLSAAPEAEHHELALVQAKEPAQKTHNVQQVSFKVKALDDV